MSTPNVTTSHKTAKATLRLTRHTVAPNPAAAATVKTRTISRPVNGVGLWPVSR